MKLSPILLSSLLLITGLACKREDGPLSPDAFSGDGQVKRPAVSPPKGATPSEGGEDEGAENPETETGTVDPLEPGEIRTTESLIDEAWAHQIAGTLQSYYIPSKALWGESWDDSAQATTALIDFMKLTGTREYLGVIQKVYDTHKSANFIRDKALSNALWATAWIHAYDLTQDKRFLETSKIILDDMDATGWDARVGDLTACGGGLFNLRSDKTNVSANPPVAITNKLSASTAYYIKLNAALHNRIEGDTKYLERANKGWLWLTTVGVVNNSGLVNNGVTTKCKNDGLQTWTHTQGLFFSAAIELNKAAPKKEYIDAAKKLFEGVLINLVTSEGILREANDSRCGTCLNDERLWKGIFMRNLREAQVELKDQAIEKFIENNILKAYKSTRSTADSIGFHWQGPFDSSD
ncbi:MAG: hypothetical protein EOP10_27455, partial [Proteobacteria bacterium]